MKLTNSTDFPNHFLRRMVSWCCKELELPLSKVSSINFRNKSFGTSGHCHVITGAITCSLEVMGTYSIEEIKSNDHAYFSRRQELGELNRDTWTPPTDPVVIRCRRSKYSAMGEYVERANAQQELERRKTLAEAARINALVSVTAHELAHRYLYLHGCRTRKSRRYGTVSYGGSENQTVRHENYLMDAFLAEREALLAQWNEPPKEREAKPKTSVVELRAVKAQRMLDGWKRKLKLAQTKVKKYTRAVRYYEKKQAAKRAD